MRPRRFEYLISYNWYGINKNGSGVNFFVSKTKVNSKKDLLDLTEIIKEETNSNTVVINNVQFLRGKRAL